MALVFDEGRNLCLGLAARSIDWRAMGPSAGIEVAVQMVSRLFSNLLQRSESIALAMRARGFAGPDRHNLYVSRTAPRSHAADMLAVGLLAVTGYVVCCAR